MWNNREVIKLAYLSGNAGERNSIAEEISPFGVKVVHVGNSLSVNIGWMKSLDTENRPEFIIISLNTPDLFTHELNPRFPKVKKYLPESIVMLLADRSDRDAIEFLQKAFQYGAYPLSTRMDVREIAQCLRDIKDGRLSQDEVAQSLGFELRGFIPRPSKER